MSSVKNGGGAGSARRWRVAAACAAALVPPALGSPAAAQATADPFSALVGNRDAAVRRLSPAAAQRFVTAGDRRGFLFQETDRGARMKFLCGPGDARIDCLIDDDAPAEEIMELTPTQGPRGVKIFKDEEGVARLRVSPYGHATVYWPGDDHGSAATKSYGASAGLSLWPADADTAMRRARQATALLSAELGAPLIFAVNPGPSRAGAPLAGAFEAASFASARSVGPGAADDGAANAAVLADAVARAANAVADVAADPTLGARLSRRARRVRFVASSAAGARWGDEELIVEYAPGGGVNGRMSSAELAAFLRGSL
ncbi:MAG: hypothetical protein ACFB00_12525 [Parvularculaceae bacterium]